MLRAVAGRSVSAELEFAVLHLGSSNSSVPIPLFPNVRLEGSPSSR